MTILQHRAEIAPPSLITILSIRIIGPGLVRAVLKVVLQEVKAFSLVYL